MKMKTIAKRKTAKNAGREDSAEVGGNVAARPVAAGSELEAGYGASEESGGAGAGAAVGEGLESYQQATCVKRGDGKHKGGTAPGAVGDDIRVRRTVEHVHEPNAGCPKWEHTEHIEFEADLGEEGKAVVAYTVTSDGATHGLSIMDLMCEKYEFENGLTVKQTLALAECLKAAALDMRDHESGLLEMAV